MTAIVPDEKEFALAKLSEWREKDQSWLAEGVKSGVLSLIQMASRLDRMPEPNADGNPPAFAVLRERLHDLATRANVDLPDP